MLEFADKQIVKLMSLLKSSSSKEQYQDLVKAVDLDTVSDALVLAQDATIDILDLQARAAANSKLARRDLWLNQTKWKPAMVDAVKRFPVSGTGLICGDKLKDRVEEFRLAEKGLQYTDQRSSRSSHFGNRDREKRSFDAYDKRGPPQKKPRYDFDFGKQNQYNKGHQSRNQRSFRGQRSGAKGSGREFGKSQ